MLQSIREHTQGWIAGTIVTIIIITFALWGVHSYFEGGSANTVAATVNGVEISQQSVATTYERLRRQAQMQSSPLSSNAPTESILKKQALDALIDMEVLKQAAFNQGFRVSSAQIDAYLQGMPEFQVEGRFSLERFQQILSSSLLSTGDFLNLIQSTLLVAQPRLGILLTSFALPNEIEKVIALVNQERDVSFLKIPLSFFAMQPIIITPAQIQSYYETHKKEFMAPQQLTVNYVELDLNDVKSSMAPSEESLKNYYRENMNIYMQPKQWALGYIEIPLNADASANQVEELNKKAVLIADELKKGKMLAEVAKQFGFNFKIDKATALANLPESWQKSVAALHAPNQVAAPIVTDKNIVVIQSLSVTEPRQLQYEDVKDKVRAHLVQQQAEEKFAQSREQLADLAYENPSSLEPAAKAFNLPIKTSESFTKDKGGNDLSQYPILRQTAFANDVLNLQNNSDVIQVSPGKVIVLRVLSNKPAALIPLEEVSSKIQHILKAQEVDKRAKQFAQEIIVKLNAGNSPQQAIEPFQMKWTMLGYVGRYGAEVDDAILNQAFKLPIVVNKFTKDVVKLSDGYAIVLVKGQKPGIIADPKKKAAFTEQVQQSEAMLEYEFYRKSVTDKASIEILPAV